MVNCARRRFLSMCSFVVIKGRLLGLDNVMICATAYFVSLLLSNFAWCMKRTGAKENAVQVLCDKVQRKL